MQKRILKRVLLTSLVAMISMSSWADSGGPDTGRHAIHDKAENTQPLMPGMKAPAFEILDPAGKPFEFDPDDIERPVIITFYRGGWCPYCNLHLAEMRHAEAEIKRMGYEILFISVDQPSVLKASLEEPDLEYQVLSDSDLLATRAFGIAFRMPDDMVALYLQHDIDLEAASGRDHHVLPVPSTFIIGTDGVIRFTYSNPNYKVRLAPEVLLAAARVYREEDVDNRLIEEYKARKEAD